MKAINLVIKTFTEGLSPRTARRNLRNGARRNNFFMYRPHPRQFPEI